MNATITHAQALRLSALSARLLAAPDLTAAGADVMVRLDYAARWRTDQGSPAWVPAWVRRTQTLRDAITDDDDELCPVCDAPLVGDPAGGDPRCADDPRHTA